MYLNVTTPHAPRRKLFAARVAHVHVRVKVRLEMDAQTFGRVEIFSAHGARVARIRVRKLVRVQARPLVEARAAQLAHKLTLARVNREVTLKVGLFVEVAATVRALKVGRRRFVHTFHVRLQLFLVWIDARTLAALVQIDPAMILQYVVAQLDVRPEHFGAVRTLEMDDAVDQNATLFAERRCSLRRVNHFLVNASHVRDHADTFFRFKVLAQIALVIIHLVRSEHVRPQRATIVEIGGAHATLVTIDKLNFVLLTIDGNRTIVLFGRLSFSCDHDPGRRWYCRGGAPRQTRSLVYARSMFQTLTRQKQKLATLDARKRHVGQTFHNESVHVFRVVRMNASHVLNNVLLTCVQFLALDARVPYKVRIGEHNFAVQHFDVNHERTFVHVLGVAIRAHVLHGR